MRKINTILFAVLAMLVVVSAVGSVIAVDSGNGTMGYEPFDETPVPADEDIDDATDGDDDSSDDGSTSVSLTKHATANPILLLMVCLSLMGIAAKH